MSGLDIGKVSETSPKWWGDAAYSPSERIDIDEDPVKANQIGALLAGHAAWAIAEQRWSFSDPLVNEEKLTKKNFATERKVVDGKILIARATINKFSLEISHGAKLYNKQDGKWTNFGLVVPGNGTILSGAFMNEFYEVAAEAKSEFPDLGADDYKTVSLAICLAAERAALIDQRNQARKSK